MASQTWIPLANSSTSRRSFGEVTNSRSPSPDKTTASKVVTIPTRPLRPQAEGHLSLLPRKQQASQHMLSNMPVAAGPQAYHSQFPSFMSVYGLDASSMDSSRMVAGDTKLETLPEDTRSPREQENLSLDNSSQHKHRDSTSTQTSESSESSPTTTISTADSSSLTDPSPSSSPESPVTIIPLSSFSATTFGIHSLDDLAMSENLLPDQLSPFTYERPMTSPTLRKPRNAKGLALNLSSSGADAPLSPSILSPSTMSPAAFVKPPPPKPRKKPSLLSLQTSANPTPHPLPRLALQPPPTPTLSRPTTLKHHHSSPQILFSPNPRGGSLPIGGMQLPPFERSSTGLSTAFRKPSLLKESTTYESTESAIEEEDLPIRTQMATRSAADIRGDIFDNPPSQEDAQERGYPDGPAMIYDPYVYLYLEPTAEEASKFDVVINVASEVQNPFKSAKGENEARKIEGAKPALDPVEPGRNSIPVPDTAEPVASEWQADSQETPTESSPTTPKALAKVEPEYIHVPWEHNTDISKELMVLCETIDSRTKEGKRVLVHCQQGASRSASLIIAYGMYKNPSLNVNDAYHAAQARSKWISPNMKLMYALQDFQKEVEKKRLSSNSNFKRGAGRSPTKHRMTLSADAVDLSPKEPKTAPLPDRDSNSPTGTPLRLRGNSSPNIGEISPGPSSAPSTFAWTPQAEKPSGQFGLWNSSAGARETRSAVLPSTYDDFNHGDSDHGQGGFFPPASYDTPPDSGFSAQRDQPQPTAFNSFPSLSAAGFPLADVGPEKNTINLPPRIVDDTPPTPSLWSPRVEEPIANPLRPACPFGQMTEVRPPSPELLSPRVADFVNPFRPAPTTNFSRPMSNFSRPLNTQPMAIRQVVDPRSPPIKGEVPIIRSIDDML